MARWWRPSAILRQFFARWGSLSVGRAGTISSIISVIVAAVLAAGIYRAAFFESVLDLWTHEGAQLLRDRTAYSSAFGGLPREVVVAVSARTQGKSALSKEAFSALLDASIALGSARAGPTGAQQPKFCVRNDVPAVLRRTPDGLFGLLEGRTVFSYGYAELSRCAGVLPKVVKPLDSQWGVTEFPCQRISALDCFKEGEYDYPDSLKELERVAKHMQESNRQRSPAYVKCTERLEQDFVNLIGAIDRENARTRAKQIMKELTGSLIPTMATWGYYYRPSLSSFKNDSGVRKYVLQAVKNGRDPKITAGKCSDGNTPCCRLWNGLGVESQSFLGGFQYKNPQNEDSEVLDIQSLRTVGVHYNENDKDWSAKVEKVPGLEGPKERLKTSRRLEQDIIDKMQPRFDRKKGSGYENGGKFSNSKLDFFLRRSSDDILRDSNGAPVPLVISGYAIMIVYTVLVLINYTRPFGSHNFIYSRALLGIFGIVVLTLGTVAGFGMMGWANVRISPTATNVLPFVALGIGLDDMFMLVFTILDRADKSRTPKERMRLALSQVGPSVTLTSCSLAVGFLVAMIVRIPGVYTFAAQLAATILFNLALLIFLFVPLCGLDCIRVAFGRPDVVPCIPVTRADEQDPDAEIIRAGGTFGRALSKFGFATIGTRFLFRGRIIGICILAVGALFTGGMLAAGIVRSERGLPLASVATTGTYQRSFLALQEEKFPVHTSHVVHIGAKPTSLAAGDSQVRMMRDAAAVQKAPGSSSRPAIRDVAWLFDSPLSLLGQYNAFNNRPSDTPISNQTEYYPFLATWLALSGGASLAGDVRCVNRTSGASMKCLPPGVDENALAKVVAIRASRMPFVHRGLVTTSDFVEAIDGTRAALARSAKEKPTGTGVTSFVYGYIYELYGQYVSSYADLAGVLGYTLLGVAMVAVLLLPIRIASIIVVGLLSSVAQGYGIGVLMGIRVNAVSITNLAVGISMAVEFSAHYAHAYARHGNDALRRTLPAITAGAFSTIFALLPLTGSRFGFVRLYYFGAWAVMTAIAAINGVIVVPAALHLFGGFSGKESNDGEEEDDDDDDSEGPADNNEREDLGETSERGQATEANLTQTGAYPGQDHSSRIVT